MALTCKELMTSTKYDVHCSNVSLICIVMGVSFTLAAYFYPVEWDFEVDPSQSARENEARREREAETQEFVYILSTTGVACVIIGGIISSFLLTKYILLQECVETEEDQIVSMQELGLGCHARTNGHRSSSSDHSRMKSDGEFVSGTADGQRSKLVDSDYLQLKGAGHQYGSTG